MTLVFRQHAAATAVLPSSAAVPEFAMQWAVRRTLAAHATERRVRGSAPCSNRREHARRSPFCVSGN